jgi:ubiquinone/menaquinone biosynthesis C-methylase UbiE
VTTILTPKSRKGYKGLPMEGIVARWYARNTAGRDHRKSAELVAGQVAVGGSILEVAPGPGYLAIELAKLGTYRVFGLDISQSFVQMAKARAQDAGVAVEFRHGDAAHMPFPQDSFDFIVCQAAFKNFSEPVQALREMHRVLKPGGKALILDLRPDASPKAINAEVKNMKLGWFNSLMTKLAFRYCLLKRAYSREQFRRMAFQTPFKTCEIQEEPLGLMVALVKGVG